MKPKEFYKGREQTFVKHFFLEKYLERVAYNILSSWREFVFVDGFSGPWKTEDESFEDSSFKIAVNQLRNVRQGIKERSGKDIALRCYFNDCDPSAFEGLQRAANSIRDMDIKTVSKSFEEAIPDIVEYIGNSFSLTFIDPTGWSGYGMEKIQPLLACRGEVIINFMFDFINRFLNDPRPEIAASFDTLYGDSLWYEDVEDRVLSGMSREDAALEVYIERLRQAGAFPHVTSTRILKPLSDRSYFHLIYGTRHRKGLQESRAVERKVVSEQEQVRVAAQAKRLEERTGQTSLFSGGMDFESYETERQKNLASARELLEGILVRKQCVLYDDVLGLLLEKPLVSETEVKALIEQLRQAEQIELPDLRGRERVPKIGHRLVWIADT